MGNKMGTSISVPSKKPGSKMKKSGSVRSTDKTPLPTYHGFSFWSVEDNFNGHGVHVWKTSMDSFRPTGRTLDNGQMEYSVEFTAGPYSLPEDAHKAMVETIGLSVTTAHRGYFDSTISGLMHTEFHKLVKHTMPEGTFGESQHGYMMFSEDRNSMKFVDDNWSVLESRHQELDSNGALYFRRTTSKDRDHKELRDRMQRMVKQIPELTHRDHLRPLFLWFDRLFVRPSLIQNGLSLQHACGALRDDPAMVLQAVRSNGVAIKFASERLKGDAKLALAAIENNAKALRYVSRPALARNDAFRASATQRLGRSKYRRSWLARVLMVQAMLHRAHPDLLLPLPSHLAGPKSGSGVGSVKRQRKMRSPTGNLASQKALWTFLLHPNTKWLLKRVLLFASYDFAPDLVSKNARKVEEWRNCRVYVCREDSDLGDFEVKKGDKVIHLAGRKRDRCLNVRSEDGAHDGFINGYILRLHYDPSLIQIKDEDGADSSDEDQFTFGPHDGDLF